MHGPIRSEHQLPYIPLAYAGAATWLSLGMYGLWWSTKLWRALDPLASRGRAWLRAVLLAMPLYGAWVLARQCDSLNDRLDTANKINVVLVGIASAAAWLLLLPTNIVVLASLLRSPLPTLIAVAAPYVAALGLVTAIVTRVQNQINATVLSSGGVAPRPRSGGWLALAAGAMVWLWFVLILAVASTTS